MVERERGVRAVGSRQLQHRAVADDVRDDVDGAIADGTGVDRRHAQHRVEGVQGVDARARHHRRRAGCDVRDAFERGPLRLEAFERRVADLVARADLDRDQLPRADPAVGRLVVDAQTPRCGLEVHAFFSTPGNGSRGPASALRERHPSTLRHSRV